MLCLNMQMPHYLIQYALICINFQNRYLNIDKARLKILVWFCWHIRLFPEEILNFFFNTLEKQYFFILFLGV